MRTITLKRKPSTQYGVFGELIDETGSHLCYTLERPWADNESDVSCVPLAKYTCIRHNSPKHPFTWEVTGVQNRSEILIHAGNTIVDTEGCILVGLYMAPHCLVQSQRALDYLNIVLDNTFTLSIVEAEQPTGETNA